MFPNELDFVNLDNGDLFAETTSELEIRSKNPRGGYSI
jgi:hypothetical protein